MVALTFTGWADLNAAIKALNNELRPVALTKALRAAGEPMRDRMSALAPWGLDAPHIADHIVISVPRSLNAGSVGRAGGATTDEEATVEVGPAQNVFYARFLEYGHSNGRGARPFMRRAFDETAAEVIERLGPELWKLIAKAAPKGGAK